MTFSNMKLFTDAVTGWYVASTSEKFGTSNMFPVFPITPQLKMPKEINAIIINGSVVVNMTKLATEKRFAEYSRLSFLPYIQSQLLSCRASLCLIYVLICLDYICIEYIAKSSKATTQVQVNKGRPLSVARRRVQPSSQIPSTGSNSYGEKKISNKIS